MPKNLERKESMLGVGTVKIRTFHFVDGMKVYDDTLEKNNLIVAVGRKALLDLLIGVRERKLGYIRWGKGGAPSFPDGDPLEPFDVEDTDTNAADALLDKQLSPYTRISDTEVRYVETLISDEVDSDVNEACMLLVDSLTQERSVFARITFPTLRLTIEKGTGIELTWIFNFNSAKENY